MKLQSLEIKSFRVNKLDFIGEYQFRFRALPSHLGWDTMLGGKGMKYPEFPFKTGDRIGQIYLEEVLPIEFIEVDELSSTERGSGGYGSTNK